MKIRYRQHNLRGRFFVANSVFVSKKVHLTSTSSLKAVLERVYGWCVDIHLGQAVPPANDLLREEVKTYIASTVVLNLSFQLCSLV